MNSGEFVPVRVVLTETDAGPAICVEDESGQQTGILIPREAQNILSKFLPRSGRKWLEMWKEYERRRGGEVLFWDLAHLAALIASSPRTSWLRDLARARDGAEVFHNAVQAQIMVSSEALRPGSVRLGEPTPPHKTPDFHVACPAETSFEVESIPRPFCLQIVDNGIRLSPTDALRLQRSLTKRAKHGFSQVGDDGTVILAIWCDHLAALAHAQQVWRTREGSLCDAIQPRRLVICTRPGQGQLNVYSFTRDDWELALEQLCASLVAPVSQSDLAFSGAVSYFSGTSWLPIGRRLCIADIQGVYSPDELSGGVASSSLSALSSDQLEWMIQITTSSHERTTAANASFTTSPLEKPSYSVDELLRDHRVLDLLGSAQELSRVNNMVEVIATPGETGARMRADLERFGAVAKQFSVTCLASEVTAAAIALLSGPRPFNLVSRIAFLHMTLAQGERHRRQA